MYVSCMSHKRPLQRFAKEVWSKERCVCAAPVQTKASICENICNWNCFLREVLHFLTELHFLITTVWQTFKQHWLNSSSLSQPLMYTKCGVKLVCCPVISSWVCVFWSVSNLIPGSFGVVLNSGAFLVVSELWSCSCKNKTTSYQVKVWQVLKY